MAASSSEPALKVEIGGGSGGGETSEGAGIPGDQLFVYRGLKRTKRERGCTAKERISKMPPCTAGKRSSIYRGVTRHRWTGRYEAHLWDKSTWNQNQNKKGKQVYLGAYDDEEAAARAYDLAALKYWGPGTLINFPVTDYTRDLEEMQNISREDYLASLRRKSSGFSRGISKYRGMSSRWDPLSRMAGPDYVNSKYNTGKDASAESEYASGFCIDRKIDLTAYIKWWGPNKNRQSEETRHDDIGSELKALESIVQPTEPYQMPRLGVSTEGKRNKGSSVSAMSILSRSAAYKSLQEKASKNQTENDENEKKCRISKEDYGKSIENSSQGARTEELGVSLGPGSVLAHRSMYPVGSFLTAPLLTHYNTIDALNPLSDPTLWTTLVPPLPTGLPPAPEVMKTETSTNYTFFQPED